jgi:hypothetical protein
MKKSAITGPVITLGAAAALGITLFSINVAHEERPGPPPAPAAVVAATSPPTSTIASKPRPAHFPAKVKYHSGIPTKKGNLTLDIKVDGAKATAYACDNYGIEQWLAGSAVDGVVTMMSKDGKSRLTGQHEGSTVVGNLSIDDKQWAFTAQTVQGYGDV